MAKKFTICFVGDDFNGKVDGVNGGDIVGIVNGDATSLMEFFGALGSFMFVFPPEAWSFNLLDFNNLPAENEGPAHEVEYIINLNRLIINAGLSQIQFVVILKNRRYSKKAGNSLYRC